MLDLILSPDTGSSDMWALTDAAQPVRPAGATRCTSKQTEDQAQHAHSGMSATTTTTSPGLSLYPVSALLHTRVRGLRARLVYGDSMTGTRAEGAVARDRAGVLGAGAGAGVHVEVSALVACVFLGGELILRFAFCVLRFVMQIGPGLRCCGLYEYVGEGDGGCGDLWAGVPD